MSELKNFFNPKSIAIIGASDSPTSLNGRLHRHLAKQGYIGSVFLINPNKAEIDGIKTYPKLNAVPDKIDLALCSVPAKQIPGVLRECIGKEIPYAIVYSAGFVESGELELQKELDEIIASKKIRVLGPNCQGFFNVAHQIGVSFSNAVGVVNPISGPAAYVSQSGAFGFSTFNVLQQDNVGFSYIVSTGNEADLEVCELMSELIEDPDAKIIASYVEGFKKPERLYPLAKKALLAEKPILIYKAGQTEASAKAAASHTAALSGADALYDVLFKQLGIIRFDDIEEFADTVKILGAGKLPRGGRVGILTTSGGVGVAMTDQLSKFGMSVPELEPKTVEVLSQNLPAFGSANNPVDLTAQVGSNSVVFTNCVKAVADDANIDIIVVLMTMVVGEASKKITENLLEISNIIDKPLVFLWIVGDYDPQPGHAVLRENNLPYMRSPRRCALALGNSVKYAEILKRKDEIIGFIDQKMAARTNKIEVKKTMQEYEAKEFFRKYGLPVTQEKLAKSSDEAVSHAKSIGFPVVMKIQSEKIMHKSDMGGVVLGVNSEKQVKQAFADIMAKGAAVVSPADIDGVLVQEMIGAGQEVILGSTSDPQLGPSVMVGLGGIFVEILKDVVFRIPAISKSEASKMLTELKGYRLLEGARGMEKADIAALQEIISRFSEIVEAISGEVEIDLNPIIVMPNGAKIVDALIVRK